MSSDHCHRLGYARVSTCTQDEALQHDALTAAGCDRIFIDKDSGKLTSRPALDDLLTRSRAGDTVLVWRPDRLGRSLRHLRDVVHDLEQRRVGFVSLTENIDTTTPGGKLVFPPVRGARRVRTRPHPGADRRRSRRSTGQRPHRRKAHHVDASQGADR